MDTLVEQHFSIKYTSFTLLDHVLRGTPSVVIQGEVRAIAASLGTDLDKAYTVHAFMSCSTIPIDPCLNKNRCVAFSQHETKHLK